MQNAINLGLSGTNLNELGLNESNSKELFQ